MENLVRLKHFTTSTGLLGIVDMDNFTSATCTGQVVNGSRSYVVSLYFKHLPHTLDYHYESHSAATTDLAELAAGEQTRASRAKFDRRNRESDVGQSLASQLLPDSSVGTLEMPLAVKPE